MSIKAKMVKQVRAIKRYAKSLNIIDLDTAAMRWVTSGCAARWATQN